MRTLALITLLAAATPALAETLSMGSQLGSTLDTAQASLKAMGYEVRKAEMEDGRLEFYVLRDGKMSEIYVSTQTGAVQKIETKN